MLLLSTAFAVEPEWKEVTDAGQLFKLGEYAANWDAQTQTVVLEHDAYFLLLCDGKYAIFSRDDEQLTAYQYDDVEFRQMR